MDTSDEVRRRVYHRNERVHQLLQPRPELVNDNATDIDAMSEPQPTRPNPGRPESGPPPLVGLLVVFVALLVVLAIAVVALVVVSGWHQ